VAILLKLRGIHVGILTLMLVAQLFGVVTLLSDHTFHLYENTGAVANAPIEMGPEGASPGVSGDDGLVDLHDDECCALHALSGPLPKAATIPSRKLTSERVEPLVLTVLSGGCPEVLERPPNPMPL
jgi:hypothetical protein